MTESEGLRGRDDAGAQSAGLKFAPGIGSRLINWLAGRRSGTRLASAILLAAVVFLAPARLPGPDDHPSVRNVILFIGDGMSVASETAAARYLYGTDTGLAWHAFAGHAYVATWDATAYNRNAKAAGSPPYNPRAFNPRLGYDTRREGAAPQAWCEPDRATAAARLRFPSTDSASAATAIATGRKTESGNIAWLPGDKPDGRLTTILEDCRALLGAGIGVVTTVPFNHATPAAFISHNFSRSAYYTGFRGYAGLGLADEIILEVKPDVVIGAGHPMLDNPDFDTRSGYISQALLDALRMSPEYALAERMPGVDGSRSVAEAAERALSEGRKLFGLYGGRDGNFELPEPLDRPGAPGFTRPCGEDPTLAQATLAALRVLAANPRGFFLTVEQGDIDWANHDNDFRGMIGAMHDLEEAVKAARAFVDRPGDDIDWNNTVLVVTADHATGGLCLNPERRLGAGELPRQVARGLPSGPVDRAPANGTAVKPSPKAPPAKFPFAYPDGEIRYGTIGHSNELVTLAVNGPAARHFLKYKGWWYPGPIIDNTQVNAALRDALGLPAVRPPD
jgi:alkaline phosphatase